MADSPEPSPEDVARQARQHVRSLRAAGIEWVPAVDEAADALSAADITAAAAAPVLQSSLFAAGPDADESRAPAQRRHELEVLAGHVAGCTRCAELVATRTQTVFGVGPPDPALCFVGEAPGGDEDRQGEPFVGQAGQLLNRIISACGLRREEVYICN